MAEESKTETKTRKKLTVTAMYEAICDLRFALLPEEARTRLGNPVLSFTTHTDGDDTFYVAALFERVKEEVFTSESLIAESAHINGIEEAIASLLAVMEKKFAEHRKVLLAELEEKQKELLSGLDSVKDRHHGALRGARSKIREKKT